MSVRKVIKSRGVFPTDEAAPKLLYLAPQNITQWRATPIKERRAALNRFAVLFEDGGRPSSDGKLSPPFRTAGDAGSG